MLKLSAVQKLAALVGMGLTSLLLAIHQSSRSTSSTIQGKDAPTGNSSTGDDMSSFCKGMFMVMSMSGFQWSLTGHGDCLSYFAPAWKLDGRGKFQGAMVYTFLLAIVAEGSHAFPVLLRPYLPKRLEHLANSLFYGMQRFMTYIIMLIAMMYSWELLISVLMGLMVGRLLFPNVTRREWRRQARRSPTAAAAASGLATLATTPVDDLEPPQPQDDHVPLDGVAAVRRRR